MVVTGGLNVSENIKASCPTKGPVPVLSCDLPLNAPNPSEILRVANPPGVRGSNSLTTLLGASIPSSSNVASLNFGMPNPRPVSSAFLGVNKAIPRSPPGICKAPVTPFWKVWPAKVLDSIGGGSKV